MDLLASTERAQVALLVAFIDLTRFTVESQARSDTDTADVLDQYYHRVDAMASESGGAVVKFIGDAALLVWPESSAEAGVLALLDFKKEVEPWFESQGWGSEVHARVGVGPVVAGPFGPRREFDVIGSTVNATARLRGNGFTVSPEALALLSEGVRQRVS